MNPLRDISTFNAVLRAGGALASLAYLNEGVSHRYTAVYRIEGDMLRNVLLHDRQGQVRTDFLDVVPLNTSFCQFVLREGLFKTDNSALDARLDGNLHQGAVLCYHGVPLMGRDAELMSTLCHFDLKAQTISDSEFELLMQAGKHLPDFLPRVPAGIAPAASLAPPV